MGLFIFAGLFCFATAQAVQGPSLLLELQAIVKQQAEKYNTSFSFAFKSNDQMIEVAAGVNDHRTGSMVDSDSVYPGGSLTKSYTAAMLMQLVEQSLVGLDDLVYEHLDPWLTQQNPPHPTLKETWKGDDTINTVTIRQLLSMRSGIKDYDDGFLHNFTITHPKVDYLPEEFVDNVDKTFFFRPDHGTGYSSVGYILAGMILAAKTGASSWDQLNQAQVLKGLSDSSVANDTFFFGKGTCAQQENPRVVHQYDLIEKHDVHSPYTIGKVSFFDVYDESCLNGWTMGNIGATSAAVAKFWYALYNNEIVSANSLKEMMTLHTFTSGFALGLRYGMGLMELNPYKSFSSKGAPSKVAPATRLYGHVGLDYGSGFTLNGFNPEFNVSVALATNNHYGIGMNCSLSQFSDNGAAAWETGCFLYNKVLQSLSTLSGTPAPPLDCSPKSMPAAWYTALPPWWFAAPNPNKAPGFVSNLRIVPTACDFGIPV